MKRFEPHSHTMYSNIRLIDCINRPNLLIDRAREIGLAGIAITDHEALCCHIGVNIYSQEIAKEDPNFKVALGNEIYLTDNRECGIDYYHFILIAKDADGHRQLRELSSLAWMNGYQDRGERVPTTKDELKRVVSANPGHLIATSACLGGELSKTTLIMENARHIGDMQTAEESKEKIVRFMLFMKELFGDDFYIECAPGSSKDQVTVNKKLMELSKVFDCKMVIGSDAHYLKKEDRYVHKSYLNSKDGDREVDDFYEFAYLQTNEEEIENLKPSFEKETVEHMWENSMEIWEKIKPYSLLHPQVIPSVEVKDYPFPLSELGDYFKNNYPILTSMYYSDDKYERYWVNECIAKLNELDLNNETYLSRLEEEADIKRTIGEKLGTNMFSYPITLQHYINMFWECGSTVGAGRGSACSGLNHYLLGVTQLDPIKWSLPFWRYLNKERVELGDIDIDLCPSKRPMILQKIKEERGQHFAENIDEVSRKNLGCTLVATFGTETTKSTILTACRGYRSEEYPDGIDNDIALYLSSLVPQERGFLWTLNEVINGDKAKGRQPVTTFITEVNKYPGLLEIMQGIEGLVSKRSSHASGVILFDEDPYEFGCFMKAPNGDITTQYDLHMAEAAGMTKYDFLLTKVQDKITACIRFLQEDGKIPSDMSLREVYDKYLHPNVIDVEDEKIWEKIKSGDVLNIFQFEAEVGSQAIKKIKPSNILELMDANGLMRLMTSEKGVEMPMEKYIRYKNDINLWYKEMNDFGITPEEQKILEPYFKSSYGVPPSQEQLMMMLMDKDICGFSLKEANDARKIVGKKQMNRIPELEEKVLKSASRKRLGEYVWKFGAKPQMGYSFSTIHSLAYSFIGYQTAYLSSKWNPIYWNTSCLVVDSGSIEQENEETKKKEKGSDYAKLAKAMGNIKKKGVEISLININSSDYSFKPDVENNRILYGMKGVNKVNKDIIDKIKQNRPYVSIKDFMIKCPVTKTVMISLIKAGAFDELHPDMTRKEILAYYINCVYGKKTVLNLRNWQGLVREDLVNKEFLDLQIRVFNFNKYLKGFKRGENYLLDTNAIGFIDRFLIEECSDLIFTEDNEFYINIKNWDKIYKRVMEKAKDWIKDNQQELLRQVNNNAFLTLWDKYGKKGNNSKWEMETLCFYHSKHELGHVNMIKYGLSNFSSLQSEEIDYFFSRGGRQIPIYKLSRIVGTVISKDDNKSSIYLLTTEGDVVNVKFTREYYSMYKKQISRINPDGTKTVIEKGWFTRGNLVMVTGFRRDDGFVAKSYKSTPTHQLYLIEDLVGDEMKLRHDRYAPDGSFEEESYEEMF